MKNLIGVAVLGLAIVLGGCGKKSTDEKASVGAIKDSSKTIKDSSKAIHIDSANASKILELFASEHFVLPSTTTITPPGVNNPSDPILVHLEGNSVLVFYQGTVQIYSPFVAGINRSAPIQIGPGPWWVTKFTPDNRNPINIQLYVNSDNVQDNSLPYNAPVIEIPSTTTKNLYMALYHGYTDNNGHQIPNATATVIVGDVGIFASDPPAIPEMGKKSDEKREVKKK